MSRSQTSKRRYTSARDRAEKQSSPFSSSYLKLPEGVQLFTPKAGRYLLDIVPFVAGKGNPWAEAGVLHWERTYYCHRGIGANNDTYICPRMAKAGRCPVCEHRLKLMKEGDEDNEQLVKDLSPKQRQLFNIINLKEPDKGVQLWDVSYHLFGKLLDARIRGSEDEDEWDKFFFLEDGLTLKVSFAEKSFGGYSFVEAESIDFRSRQEQYDDDILEKVHCLDELLVVPDYEDLKKTFLEAKDTGKDEEDDDEEDEEEEERPAKRSTKPVAAAEEDDEDEEEDAPPPKKSKKQPADDDEDWDDFDEEDEKPAKKKSSKPSDDDEEDEDDDDEESEEDEEEEDAPPPKKKSKPTPKDDDEDDWDDDDEEEEEKPRVRAGAKDDDEDEEPPRKKKSK